MLAGADVIADYNGASSDALLREYLTPGLDDNAIVFVPSDDDYYYFKDGLGSVRNIIDTSGDVQNYYDYEAFGSPYDAQSSPPVTNRYTYTGRELDGESTTYYYRFRQYHAGQGRFSARDPIPAGRSSMYAYVRSNPCYFKDPFGLQEEKLDP